MSAVAETKGPSTGWVHDLLAQTKANANKKMPKLPPSTSVPPSPEHAKYCRKEQGSAEVKPNGHALNGEKPNGFSLDLNEFEAAVRGTGPGINMESSADIEDVMRNLAARPEGVDDPRTAHHPEPTPAPAKAPRLTLEQIRSKSAPAVPQPRVSLDQIRAMPSVVASPTPEQTPEWQRLANKTDEPYSPPVRQNDDDDGNANQSSNNAWAGFAVAVALLVVALVVGLAVLNRPATSGGSANVAGFLRQMGPVPASIVPMHKGIPASIAAARGPAAQLTIGGVPVRHVPDVKVAVAVPPLAKELRPAPRPHRVEAPVATPRFRPARPVAASVAAVQPARPASAGQQAGTGSLQDQLMHKFGCEQKPSGSKERNSCMDRVVKILDNAHEALKKGLALPTIFTQPAPARAIAVSAPVQQTPRPVAVMVPDNSVPLCDGVTRYARCRWAR